MESESIMSPERMTETLKEFGYDERLIHQAVSISDNDINKAVAYLNSFGQSSDSDENENMDSTIFENEYDNSSNGPIHKLISDSGDEGDERIYYSEQADYSNNDSSVDSRINVNANKEYSVFEDSDKFQQTEDIPSVLLPSRLNFSENYFVHLIRILHEVPHFRNLILKKGFPNYGYKLNWWNDSLITLPNENSIEEIRLLLEIQRLMGFLDHKETKRSFTNTKTFLRHLPLSILQSMDDDYFSQSFEIFFRTLINQIGTLSEDSISELDSLMISKLSATDTSYTLFSVEMEINLYQTFISALWNNDIEEVCQHSITKLGKIVTIVYESPTHYSFEGSDLDEIFFPQIFTTEFNSVIKSMVVRIKELNEQIESLRLKFQNNMAFEGKKVEFFLEESIKYFEQLKVNDDEKDILKETINVLKETQSRNSNEADELREKVSKLNHEKKNLNVKDINSILNFIKSLQNSSSSNDLNYDDYKHIFDQSYHLVGIIVNENEFFYLLNSQHKTYPNCWVHTLYSGSSRINNFAMELTEFDVIKRYIKNYHRSDSSKVNMLLIYARKDCLEEKINEDIPESLKAFLKLDEAELIDSISNTNKSMTDYDSSSMDDAESSIENSYQKNLIDLSDSDEPLINLESDDDNENKEKSKTVKLTTLLNDIETTEPKINYENDTESTNSSHVMNPFLKKGG